MVAVAIGRRSFLLHTGRGVVGVAVLGLAGCIARDDNGLSWSRVDLAYVSAYVLVRGGEAALVDAGLVDSADRIGEVLEAAGPGWDGLRYVVITHAHNDHFASLFDVAHRAPGATLFAGAPDFRSIELQLRDYMRLRQPELRMHAVADGDEVFGLQVVATPGHTRGHGAVFDPDTAVLVAGDALTNTVDGVLTAAEPQFTVDQEAAADSVRKLATLRPQVILVGDGPPVERDAAAKLRRLANA